MCGGGVVQCRGRGHSTTTSSEAWGMSTWGSGALAVASASRKSTGWSRREGKIFCEASPGRQGAQRVQCSGMAEQKGCFVRSLCLAGSWPLQKQFAQFGGQVAKSLGRAGGCSRAVELFWSIWAAGSQAGNGTVGDTLTFEEPLTWKEAVMLHSPSQGHSVDPMQVSSPNLTQI